MLKDLYVSLGEPSMAAPSVRATTALRQCIWALPLDVAGGSAASSDRRSARERREPCVPAAPRRNLRAFGLISRMRCWPSASAGARRGDIAISPSRSRRTCFLQHPRDGSALGWSACSATIVRYVASSRLDQPNRPRRIRNQVSRLREAADDDQNLLSRAAYHRALRVPAGRFVRDPREVPSPRSRRRGIHARHARPCENLARPTSRTVCSNVLALVVRVLRDEPLLSTRKRRRADRRARLQGERGRTRCSRNTATVTSRSRSRWSRRHRLCRLSFPRIRVARPARFLQADRTVARKRSNRDPSAHRDLQKSYCLLPPAVQRELPPRGCVVVLAPPAFPGSNAPPRGCGGRP